MREALTLKAVPVLQITVPGAAQNKEVRDPVMTVTTVTYSVWQCDVPETIERALPEAYGGSHEVLWAI